MSTESLQSRLPEAQCRLQNWWEHGDQDRPCFLITLPHPSPIDLPDTENLVRWWTDVDFIIRRQMVVIDSQDYLGEAMPFHYVDRGSSAMEGILGANMEFVDKQTVWASPCFESVEQ